METSNLRGRPTVAEVDLSAMRHNYLELRRHVPAGTGVMAVVKANAYGHGDVEAARLFESLGCEFFGVATAEEGERLRSGGVKNPVVVLGGIYPGQAEEVVRLGLTPVVFDTAALKVLDTAARAAGVVRDVHVKIDTGMSRLGLRPNEVARFFTALREFKNIRLEGVLSHFVESESDDRSFSDAQLKEFVSVLTEIRRMGFEPKYTGMANSAAAVDYAEAGLDLVRAGIMLYGAYPSARLRGNIALKPAMTLKTRVLQLKRVPAGTPVSYGRTFITERESLLATLPIGYADGLPRRLSGRAEVIVRGKRAPLVGTICMDLTVCDVTGVDGVETGDPVVLIGSQGTESITAEEMAEKAGTISYEVFCNISWRVPRVYKESGA